MGLGIPARSLQSLVDLREGSTTWGMETTPPCGSSGEY